MRSLPLSGRSRVNLVCLGFAVGALQTVSAAAATITVGTRTLTFCDSDYNGYCGSITRPLDPTGAVTGTITIGFTYYPRLDQTQSALGTILPQEGGPGYSSTGTHHAYLNVFGSQRQRRNILIVDKRGTGKSSAINCIGIQKGDPLDPAALANCGLQLGVTAPLYNTHLAVDDVVAVMNALKIFKVDYYGDSYGTYFGQVFAAYYPGKLRSIVLDSAYPVRAPDGWFPAGWATGWNGLDLVCSRSLSCRALGGSSTARIQTLLGQLRQAPMSGAAPDADGNLHNVTLDVPMLFRLLTNLGNVPFIYRDLDAATRAWLDSGDTLPLLRLASELSTPFTYDASDFSYGLYQAVICQEYPLLYDPNSKPAERKIQYDAALADARVNRPNLFAPFTIDEAATAHSDLLPWDSCINWPKPPATWPHGDPLPATPVFPNVPTLVLSGDLDSVTAPADAVQVAALFPNVTHLIIPNLTHVTAWTYIDVGLLPDGGDTTHCVQAIIRRFIGQLSPGDTSCITKVRPIRTPPRFSKTADGLTAAKALTGNVATAHELRLASAALETVGDAFARFLITYGIGSGLRGGSFTYFQATDGYAFKLTRLKWTEDLNVTGTMHWYTKSGKISASVQLRQGTTSVGNLTMTWNDLTTNASATLTGTISGHNVNAQRIAP